MSPFEFSNSILNGKEIIFDSYLKKEYNSFIVNRALSMYIDTISQANQMNINYQLDSDIKYAYLYNSIRKKKRPFVKWPKMNKFEYINDVMVFYNININKALEILNILSENDLKKISNIVKTR